MTPEFNLIAFTGRLGSGKTTAAKTLVRQYGFTRIGFADTLRSMLQALGLTVEELTEKKEQPLIWIPGTPTPRRLMQTLGTNWGREMISNDIWLMAAQRRIRRLRTEGVSRIVIDDCRFDNEAGLVRTLGGSVIGIQRPGTCRVDHASEQGVSPDLVHYTIGNDWPREDMFVQAVAYIFEGLR